jgi:hypothetical protein
MGLAFSSRDQAGTRGLRGKFPVGFCQTVSCEFLLMCLLWCLPQVMDFLTIHLLKSSSKKERAWYPHGKNSLINGAYTNNPHCLIRYDVTGPDDEYISLVLSQYMKSHDLGYTLSCFCTQPFTLGKPRKELSFTKDVTSSWTPASAGGPVGKNDFFRNPMYAITIPDDATVELRCSTVKTFAGKSKKFGFQLPEPWVSFLSCLVAFGSQCNVSRHGRQLWIWKLSTFDETACRHT